MYLVLKSHILGRLIQLICQVGGGSEVPLAPLKNSKNATDRMTIFVDLWTSVPGLISRFCARAAGVMITRQG